MLSHHPTRRARNVAYGVLILLFLGAASLLLLPTKATVREPQFCTVCANNLRLIGIALRDYHYAHGSYPPQYATDTNGHPLYSWRVLLLPYLEMDPLYKQLHLDEPWNSRHNKPLLDSDLPGNVFRCPSDSKGTSFFTSYLAVVRHGVASPQPVGSDGSPSDAGRITVAEIKGSAVHWAEPVDLDAEEAIIGINRREGCIGSNHPSGAHVLFSSGEVRFLEDAAKSNMLTQWCAEPRNDPVPKSDR